MSEFVYDANTPEFVRPQFEPGIDRGVNCSRCHSDPHERREEGRKDVVVTTGERIFIEGDEDGTIIGGGLFTMCETCINELAHGVGMIAKLKADELRQKNRELGAENKRLREKLEKFEVAASLQVEALAS